MPKALEKIVLTKKLGPKNHLDTNKFPLVNIGLLILVWKSKRKSTMRQRLLFFSHNGSGS